MDAKQKAEVQKMIDQAVTRAMDFTTRKRGDTPTDEWQLTPKGYVDSHAGGAAAGSSTQVQFNTGGILDASSRFLFTFIAGVARIVLGVVGEQADIESPANMRVFTSFDSTNGSGDIDVFTGDSSTQSSGDIRIQTGTVTLSGSNRNGNILLNAQGNYGSTVKAGFVYIPCLNGNPSNSPTVATNGAMAFVPSTGKLYVWNGSAWVSVTLS